MGYESFDITAPDLRLDADRLPALLEAARRLGYLDEGEDDAGEEREQVEEVLSRLFEAWDLDDGLRLGDVCIDWLPGTRFPIWEAAEILAAAATEGSTLSVVDFTDGDRDVYDIVFDGAGNYDQRMVVRDGAPVR